MRTPTCGIVEHYFIPWKCWLMLVNGLVKLVLYLDVNGVNGVNLFSSSILMQQIVDVVNLVNFCFISFLGHCILVKWKISSIICACAFDFPFL